MDVKQQTAIEGVSITPLKIMEDERGAVMHMLRCDSPRHSEFGEVYFSVVRPGVVKGWKRHQRMTQNFAVPHGLIKLVVIDDRSCSSSCGVVFEIVIGRPANYSLVTLPPMLWYGFQNIANHDAIVANCTDIAHDPGESEQKSLMTKDLCYAW